MEVSLNLTEKALRDFELVQSARQNNNQQAYTQLMKLYRDSIYFMLLKMTNNSTDAEDLTIEAFGKAFKKLDRSVNNYFCCFCNYVNSSNYFHAHIHKFYNYNYKR